MGLFQNSVIKKNKRNDISFIHKKQPKNETTTTLQIKSIQRFNLRVQFLTLTGPETSQYAPSALKRHRVDKLQPSSLP